MVASGKCSACRPSSISGLMTIDPHHCNGSGDRRAPKGVLGGFECSCPCRYRPDELWNMADAWAKGRATTTASEQAAYRIARYNELMVEAGHVIIKKEQG